jgi:hypothetical protein
MVRIYTRRYFIVDYLKITHVERKISGRRCTIHDAADAYYDIPIHPADRFRPHVLAGEGDTFENILKSTRRLFADMISIPQVSIFIWKRCCAAGFGAPASNAYGRPGNRDHGQVSRCETLDMSALKETMIRTRGGGYLRLGQVASFEERPIAGSIDRENQKFQQTLMWEFRGPAKAEENFRKTFSPVSISGRDFRPRWKTIFL